MGAVYNLRASAPSDLIHAARYEANANRKGSQLGAVRDAFLRELPELKRVIAEREGQLRYPLGIKFRETERQFEPGQGPERWAQTIRQWAFAHRKAEGYGVDDGMEVNAVDAEGAAATAFTPGGEMDAADPLDAAFLKSREALTAELQRALKENPGLKLFSVVSWDCVATINELAIADPKSGRVLFIGLSHL
jgi:hypothetical protein